MLSASEESRRLMHRWESLELMSEKLLLNVLILIICIRREVEVRGSMELWKSVRDQRTREVIGTGERRNGLYYFGYASRVTAGSLSVTSPLIYGIVDLLNDFLLDQQLRLSLRI